VVVVVVVVVKLGDRSMMRTKTCKFMVNDRQI
jgi:hypothetical protein